MKIPLANARYRKPAEILSRFLCFTGLAVWIFHLYMFLQYDATRPRQFDRSSGHIYAQMNHGHVVYLTKQEDRNLTKLTLLAFLLFGAGFLIGALFVEKIDWTKRREPKAWEMKRW